MTERKKLSLSDLRAPDSTTGMKPGKRSMGNLPKHFSKLPKDMRKQRRLLQKMVFRGEKLDDWQRKWMRVLDDPKNLEKLGKMDDSPPRRSWTGGGRVMMPRQPHVLELLALPPGKMGRSRRRLERSLRKKRWKEMDPLQRMKADKGHPPEPWMKEERRRRAPDKNVTILGPPFLSADSVKKQEEKDRKVIEKIGGE